MSTLVASAGSAKTLWYLTRGTGAVAMILLTAGVVLGVMTTARLQTLRLPRFLVSGLHRNLTLLAVAFLVVHIVSTVLDGFVPIGLKDAFLPFLSGYRPVWLGLGAVAFDLLLALIITSLARARIGVRAWRGFTGSLRRRGGSARPRPAPGTTLGPGWLGVLAVACTGAVASRVNHRHERRRILRSRRGW